ncbi:hypothetical protein [Candidatus Wolbachia massiliensis]|uniref:Uncharacterized protein n=1 Tax=Candidatus Wolbachia massiliensis TaxID=1845000 RepID=A0A7L7YLE2_9RICK|nr:hypothetical protein [Candidatus Wolbachia massiliensis]QOD38072.1 hypothetical protein ID128_04585 [Candidatus Wolbachia massiliensis]
MAQIKNTQENVEKKFKDVFERSPGAFSEGASLEEKVGYIAKRTKALNAKKNKELESKMKNVAELSKELESRESHATEKVHQDFERIAELDRQYEGKGIFRSEKVAESQDNKKLQDAPRETTAEGKAEGKSVEQNERKEVSMQTDMQPSKVEGLRDNPEFQEAASNLKKNTASQAVGSFSVSRSPTREKSSDKKPESNRKDNTPQPQEDHGKKEEGLFSLLKRLIKKVLEKLLDEDEKSVKNTRNMKGDAQRNMPNSEEQQKSMNQGSFININGKQFDLEPEKTFNYQDKALNLTINVTSNQLKPETEQHLQQGTTALANTINLNINGKEYNIQPGESFNHESPGLKVSVVNGHQQSKNFDKILSQDQGISESLKQVTQLENPAITPANTPKVNEVNTGRER